MNDLENMGIYIHVPWCRRRCPYCDFYLVVGRPHLSFVDNLLSEWQLRKDDWPKKPAASLYFGGGTPSLLKLADLKRLISFFKDTGALSTDAEITLEANPEDLSVEYVQGLSSLINRISLGIQSFDDKSLVFLGRKHRAHDAKAAILSAKQAGIDNISVDLIIGVANEDQASILASIDLLAALKVAHLSCYLLTIEEKTSFYKRLKNNKLPLLTEDEQAEIYAKLQAKLAALSYVQYDVSSYAKDAQYSRHNQIYWGGGSYIGLGPGAHSMCLLSNGGIKRSYNKTISEWLIAPGSSNELAEELSKEAALKESLAFGLRNMAYGIDPMMLSRRHLTKIPDGFDAVCEKFIKNGYLEQKEGRFFISQEGALFADSIMREILFLA